MPARLSALKKALDDLYMDNDISLSVRVSTLERARADVEGKLLRHEQEELLAAGLEPS